MDDEEVKAVPESTSPEPAPISPEPQPAALIDEPIVPEAPVDEEIPAESPTAKQHDSDEVDEVCSPEQVGDDARAKLQAWQVVKDRYVDEADEEEKYEVGDEGINEQDKVAISSKIKAIKQHWFENDKVEQQVVDNANETQWVEFWNQKKAGFVLTKTWQDDWWAILHIHKKVVLTIFKRVMDQMKDSRKENAQVIQYFQNLVSHERNYAESIRKNSKLWGNVKTVYTTKGESFG